MACYFDVASCPYEFFRLNLVKPLLGGCFYTDPDGKRISLAYMCSHMITPQSSAAFEASPTAEQLSAAAAVAAVSPVRNAVFQAHIYLGALLFCTVLLYNFWCTLNLGQRKYSMWREIIIESVTVLVPLAVAVAYVFTDGAKVSNNHNITGFVTLVLIGLQSTASGRFVDHTYKKIGLLVNQLPMTIFIGCLWLASWQGGVGAAVFLGLAQVALILKSSHLNQSSNSNHGANGTDNILPVYNNHHNIRIGNPR
jgi:hypothetical protein